MINKNFQNFFSNIGSRCWSNSKILIFDEFMDQLLLHLVRMTKGFWLIPRPFFLFNIDAILYTSSGDH